MTFYQHPDDGTALVYSDSGTGGTGHRQDLPWDFVQFLLSTGWWTITASSNGSGAPIVTSADLHSNTDAYVVLHATEDRGGIVIQRRASILNWCLWACPFGDTFSAGGSATRAPSAAQEMALVSSGTTNTPGMGTQFFGTWPNNVIFLASDAFPGGLTWQLFGIGPSLQDTVIGRLPSVQASPLDTSPDTGMYTSVGPAFGTSYIVDSSGTVGAVTATAAIANNFNGQGNAYAVPRYWNNASFGRMFLTRYGVCGAAGGGDGLSRFLFAPGLGYIYKAASRQGWFVGPNQPAHASVTLYPEPLRWVGLTEGSFLPPGTTVAVISPTPGTQISRSTPFVVELTNALAPAVLLAQFAGFRAHEVAWTGTEFTSLYARDSVVQTISESRWRLTLRREGGWPAAPSFSVPGAVP